MSRLPYKEPAVRDLAWSLFSPPLLLRNDPGLCWPGGGWFTSLGQQFHEHLLQLDSDPRPLLDMLSECRDQRLGSRFEVFWRYWLSVNPRYSLLHANLPVRSDGRTLGEFDLIVRDHRSGKTLHWELAVKFYLGAGDTRRPSNWWGPHKRDRLDIKTQRLLLHQTRLSGHPAAQRMLAEQRLHIDETWVLMKGRLFYRRAGTDGPPADAHPQHQRGFWVPAGELDRLAGGTWRVLEKQQWLAPVVDPAGTGMSKAELIERLRHRPERYPICVAASVDGVERERGFIVADGWSETES